MFIHADTQHWEEVKSEVESALTPEAAKVAKHLFFDLGSTYCDGSNWGASTFDISATVPCICAADGPVLWWENSY
jgi:hypothetical protein